MSAWPLALLTALLLNTPVNEFQAGSSAWLDDEPEPFDESWTPYEGLWIDDGTEDDAGDDPG